MALIKSCTQKAIITKKWSLVGQYPQRQRLAYSWQIKEPAAKNNKCMLAWDLNLFSWNHISRISQASQKSLNLAFSILVVFFCFCCFWVIGKLLIHDREQENNITHTLLRQYVPVLWCDKVLYEQSKCTDCRFWYFQWLYLA